MQNSSNQRRKKNKEKKLSNDNHKPFERQTIQWAKEK
jgi:hypothetical protein